VAFVFASAVAGGMSATAPRAPISAREGIQSLIFFIAISFLSIEILKLCVVNSRWIVLVDNIPGYFDPSQFRGLMRDGLISPV
jgi:hypothetical protein